MFVSCFACLLFVVHCVARIVPSIGSTGPLTIHIMLNCLLSEKNNSWNYKEIREIVM